MNDFIIDPSKSGLRNLIDLIGRDNQKTLDEAEIHAGCDYLIKIGIITAERKEAILNTPIVYEELP